MWDVFANSTYFTVSLLSGIQDFFLILLQLEIVLKQNSAKHFYGITAFGWTGFNQPWQRHESLSLVWAGLSTPLVLSVHTIVSFELRHICSSRLAYHHLPSLFRCWCDLLRFRHGTNTDAGIKEGDEISRSISHIGHIEAMNKVIVLTGFYSWVLPI
jgi:molybdopterin-containing oxidoreductase family membrane subunit